MLLTTSFLTYLRHGTIGRRVYFSAGPALLLLKQVLDRMIASLFHQHWDVWSYWLPLGRLAKLQSLTLHERDFLIALTELAIPFVVAGVVLTLARLRTIAMPLWLVVLFFALVLNLIFFLLISRRGQAAANRAGLFILYGPRPTFSSGVMKAWLS